MLLGLPDGAAICRDTGLAIRYENLTYMVLDSVGYGGDFALEFISKPSRQSFFKSPAWPEDICLVNTLPFFFGGGGVIRVILCDLQ